MECTLSCGVHLAQLDRVVHVYLVAETFIISNLCFPLFLFFMSKLEIFSLEIAMSDPKLLALNVTENIDLSCLIMSHALA